MAEAKAHAPAKAEHAPHHESKPAAKVAEEAEHEARAASAKRAKEAAEEAPLEIRPVTHPGIKSEPPRGAYSVDHELRQLWPDIELASDK